MSTNAHLLPIALPALRNGPWERRRYWLPEGFTVSTMRTLLVIDSTRSHHTRQARDLEHEGRVQSRAVEKRARRAARRLALRDLARLRSMQDAIARAEALAGGAL